MNIRVKILTPLVLICLTNIALGQSALTLQECRDMALKNNQQSKIAHEKLSAAEYEKKAAFANYLPKISATGAYLHNSENISLISDDQSAALTNLGTNMVTSIGSRLPGLMQDPALANLIQNSPAVQQMIGKLQNGEIATALNEIGSNLASEFEMDIANIYVGAVTVEEPLYAGGKIRAYNKVTAYAKELAEAQMSGEDQKVMVSVDEAYWQIVSIANKLKLTEKYVELLRKLNADVEKMRGEGLATQADQFSVKVKLNDGEMKLVKARNGLALSKMLLCQLCGMDLHTDITLADETNENLTVPADTVIYTQEEIDENRVELKSLRLASEMYNQKVSIVRADYLPTVALLGSYTLTNPSAQNGFQNKFGDMLSFGVVARIPIYHFGEGMNKVNKAKAEARIAQYQLDEARNKITLQVTQYEQRIKEADSRLELASGNMENAEENLRMANIGFKEGYLASTSVLEAQTAWLQAHSEEIDAKIDKIMAIVYLRQATGQLK
ncbi:MAG: TolC family protein [Salinivirgaceae bacterium]|nr:TolC family protein [Salinivirgaceae bacterium]